ncbi:hypothetical protein DL769_008970 [Monosporascus sp. CRB-8-3]|nr:hypothetical protein DL769_008970 [Monosporascus sp. CRB-8-3]
MRTKVSHQIPESAGCQLTQPVDPIGVGAAAAIAAAPFGPVAAGLGFLGGTIAGLFHLNAQSASISTAQRLEREAADLKNKLELLSGEEQSISCKQKTALVDIISQALDRLSMMQGQIDMFMEFLINIQMMIKRAVDDRDLVFKTGQSREEQREEWEDTELKKEILSAAYVMKTRFLLALKASECYKDISEQCVMPGVTWLAQIRLNGASNSEIDGKVKEIEGWRTKLCVGAESLAIQASPFRTNSIFRSLGD